MGVGDVLIGFGSDPISATAILVCKSEFFGSYIFWGVYFGPKILNFFNLVPLFLNHFQFSFRRHLYYRIYLRGKRKMT